MAIFDEKVTGVSPTQNFVTPQEGVTKQPLVTNALSGMLDQFKAERSRGNERFLADFTSEAIKLIDAVDQGANSQFARTQIRTNLMKAIQERPNLREELLQANASILGIAGLGGVVQTGGLEERRTRAIDDSLISSGVVAVDADEATLAAARDRFVETQAAAAEYAQQKAALDQRVANLNLSKSELEYNNALRKQNAESFLTRAAPGLMDQFQAEANDILGRIGVDMTAAEAEQAIEVAWAQFNTTLQSPLAEVDTSFGNAMLQGYEQFKEIVLKKVRGEYDDAEYDRQISRVVQQQQIVALNNPTISRAVALSKLTNSDYIFGAEEQIREAMSDFVIRNIDDNTPAANLFMQTGEGRAAVSNYLKMISVDDPTPEQRAEQAKHLSSIFSGIEDYQIFLEKSPENAIGLVNDWIASPEFLRLRNSNPEAFSDISTATQILKDNYEFNVWNMVKDQFRQNNVVVRPAEVTPNGRPRPGTQEMGSSDSVVSYRSTANGMEFYAIDPSNSAARRQARQLNGDLKSTINSTVRAFAHLDGSTDYKGYFESIEEQIMSEWMTGEGGDTNVDGGASDDSLSLEDFQTRIQEESESAEQVSDPAGQVVEAGRGYTVVRMEDGSVERRTGTRAWRNNNPGNIEYGNFAKSKGAIGTDGRFAVFSTYQEGRDAKEALLFESPSYRNRTIISAIHRYAPQFENDTNSYARQIAAAAGVDINTPLSSLSQSQRKKLLDAMERVEGFREGTTERI